MKKLLIALGAPVALYVTWVFVEPYVMYPACEDRGAGRCRQSDTVMWVNRVYGPSSAIPTSAYSSAPR